QPPEPPPAGNQDGDGSLPAEPGGGTTDSPVPAGGADAGGVDAGGPNAGGSSAGGSNAGGSNAGGPDTVGADAGRGAVEGGEVGPGAALPPEPSPQAPPGAEAAAPGEVGKVADEGDDDDTDPDPSGWVGSSGAAPSASPAAAPAASVLEVRELDWNAIRDAVAHPPSGERAERIIAGMEQRLSGGGPLGLAFEESAAGPGDRAIQVGEEWPLSEVWFIGDLHGDLLALEAALQHIDRSGGGPGARIVFLGDLFDDGKHAAQVVLRVFELLLNGPARITIVAGNHDEALAYADGRFQSTVLPSDFTDWLNAHADDPLAVRLGHVIIQFFARAPRALFFPDGLLVAHGGIPHTDLHEELAKTGNWNDPRILQDFVWLRAHPRARKRIPNRTTRGSEFGRDDFTAFCGVATKLGRPVERMLRGHDHVEERFAVYPAWVANPVLTMNALSHRLPREVFGPYARVPVVGKWVRGELPEVRRLFVPPELIQEIYPEPVDEPPAQEVVA
ncbi:MAG TPA: metallophosphoesterase, partial [Longimicrobium sp.]|nr:metallophosphoesterase [Longimicrobium sp.]